MSTPIPPEIRPFGSMPHRAISKQKFEELLGLCEQQHYMLLPSQPSADSSASLQIFVLDCEQKPCNNSSGTRRRARSGKWHDIVITLNGHQFDDSFGSNPKERYNNLRENLAIGRNFDLLNEAVFDFPPPLL